MRKRSHLVPTPVITKNGVQTTVHKKPSGTNTSVAPLPAPAVATHPAVSAALTQEEREMVIDQIHRKLRNIYDIYDRDRKGWAYDLAAQEISDYPDRTVTALRDYILPETQGRESEQERSGFVELLYTGVTDGITAREYLVYRHHITQVSPRRATDMIRSVRSYPQFSGTDSYTDTDSKTKTQVTALLVATERLHMHYTALMREARQTHPVGNGKEIWNRAPRDFSLPLTDDGNVLEEEVAALIIDHPDKMDDITGMIINDGITDTGLLREIIESDTQSLRGGLL